MALLAALSVTPAKAVTYIWTGGNEATPWHDSGNWSGGSVPTTGTTLSTPSGSDIVIFDSETAVNNYMPTDTITVSNDWSSGVNLAPSVQILNGTINYTGPSGDWWHWGSPNIFQVGDGDMTTMAQVNSSFDNWTRHFDSGSSPNRITVNADGIFNQTVNFRFSTGGSNDAQLTLNGGVFTSTGTVTDLVTGDLDDFVSFTSASSTFTAMWGGDFLILDDVTDAFGTHILNNTGGGTLSAVDNGATFTVSIIPEPSSSALLGLGLLGMLTIRRRSRS